MLKKYKGEIIFFYICAIVSLIVASFKDLAIDVALNNPTDPLSLWFYATGEVPARLVLPLAGIVLFYLTDKILSKLLGLALTIGGSVYLGIWLASYLFKEENQSVFGAVYGLGLGLIILFVGKYIAIPKKLKKPLVIFAYAGVLATIAEILVAESTKYFWSRPRYRFLITDEGKGFEFTQWYHPNGLKFINKIREAGVSSNEGKSFPSGHTASAAVSYLAMLLPYIFKKLQNKQVLCFAVPFVYTSILAYTRMVMGAHFLSDVTCGAIFTFTIIVIAMAFIDKKYHSQLEIK